MSKCPYGFGSPPDSEDGSKEGSWLSFFGLTTAASTPPVFDGHPKISEGQAKCPYGFDRNDSSSSRAPITNDSVDPSEVSPPSVNITTQVHKSPEHSSSPVSQPRNKCPFMALGEDPNCPEFSDANPAEVSRDWRIAYGTGNIERSDDLGCNWSEDMDSISLTVLPSREVFSAKELSVKFSRQRVVISFKDNSWSLDMDLNGEILPEECTWTVCKGVIDVTLQKAEEDVWHRLTR